MMSYDNYHNTTKVTTDVQVWAITAPSQPLFPMTRHSLTVLARHSLRQWHRRVWSCLVDVRAVLAVLAYDAIAQGSKRGVNFA